MKLAHKHSKKNLEYAQYIIQLNGEVVKSELKELVKKSVEETLKNVGSEK